MRGSFAALEDDNEKQTTATAAATATVKATADPPAGMIERKAKATADPYWMTDRKARATATVPAGLSAARHKDRGVALRSR
jgi:hypothetical protein